MSGKKSFFEKLGLVESTEKDVSIDDFQEKHDLTDEYEETIAEVEVNMQGKDFLSIESIYAQSNLNDLNRSIFKVDEYSKVLPESLPAAVKRQSVIGILTASNLTVDELISDAEQRIGTLNAVQKMTNDSTNTLISEKEERIANLLAAVDVLKQEINDRKLSQEIQDKAIKEEFDKIKEIIRFING